MSAMFWRAACTARRQSHARERAAYRRRDRQSRVGGSLRKALADLLDMQDEIVARLANTLNAQLIAAEARHAERAPNPNSMDLYFQGMARINRGTTPEYINSSTRLFRARLGTRSSKCRGAGLDRVGRRYGEYHLHDRQPGDAARLSRSGFGSCVGLGSRTCSRSLDDGQNPYRHQPRWPRHCRMSARIGSGSKFGRRSRCYRSCQDF